jgi:hypothetical protein
MSTQAVELLAADLNPQGGAYCGTVYKLKAGEVVGHHH